MQEKQQRHDFRHHIAALRSYLEKGGHESGSSLSGRPGRTVRRNAVTACAGSESPLIRMRSRLSDGILTIVMDNRYTDIRRTPEGGFCSTKPGGGVGLWSIRSVAEKYDGGCRFEAADTVFSSSVYLRLD